MSCPLFWLNFLRHLCILMVCTTPIPIIHYREKEPKRKRERKREEEIKASELFAWNISFVFLSTCTILHIKCKKQNEDHVVIIPCEMTTRDSLLGYFKRFQDKSKKHKRIENRQKITANTESAPSKAFVKLMLKVSIHPRKVRLQKYQITSKNLIEMLVDGFKWPCILLC